MGAWKSWLSRSRLGAGLVPLSDVGADNKPGKPDNTDSHFSDSDRAAIDYARQLRDEKMHWAWLWKKLGWILKWPTLAGGVVITMTMLEKLLKAIRDGL